VRASDALTGTNIILARNSREAGGSPGKDSGLSGWDQVRSELKRTAPANDAQREHLEALQGEVRAALDHPGEIPPEAHESLGQRVTDSLQHFEATHAVLSSMLEQILNTLSGAGI